MYACSHVHMFAFNKFFWVQNEFMGINLLEGIMKKDLEKRLIVYANGIINISEHVKKNYAGVQLTQQIIRSGISAALNYGEAQSAESKRDFIHKVSIVLKELRETFINLQIVEMNKTCRDQSGLQYLIKESDELIAIFYKTLQTAKGRYNK